VEQHNFKLSKNESKWKVCTSSTKFRWSQVMMASKLLRESLESGQLSQP
jgi:hypothetical protein